MGKNKQKKIVAFLTLRDALSQSIHILPQNLERNILNRMRERLDEWIIIDEADGEEERNPLGGGFDRVPFGHDGPDIEHDIPDDRTVDNDFHPVLTPCAIKSIRDGNSLASRQNHWWQNWGKNHAFICERMFFPLSVGELSAAVGKAEQDNAPVRAIGGGWSFSDVAIPAGVSTVRPFSPGLEAFSKMVPLSEGFSTDDTLPIIAEIDQPTDTPSDNPESLQMYSPLLCGPDERWTYSGGGVWAISDPWAVVELFDGPERAGLSGLVELGIGLPISSADALSRAMLRGYYPINLEGDDAGSIVIFDLTSSVVLPRFFYNGSGKWTRGVLDPTPELISFSTLFTTLPPNVFPISSSAAFTMSTLAIPQRAYLINTQHMASSLQQHFPKILSDIATQQTDPGTFEEPNTDQRYFFHVEGGITMEALTELLSHQSPRLAIEASGGSPGATLAGALATATHGGEHNRPLLVDRVKAVHLVGPGGIQWWIEGDDSIANPDKLMDTYPCLARDQIISGREPVDGISPQDWLNAVVVSMGSMGVIYSIVLEVVPIFGLHEVVVESTWSEILQLETFNFRLAGGVRSITMNDLRDPPSLDTERSDLGSKILEIVDGGSLTGIEPLANQYIDIAIDPNPIDGTALASRNWNCWVINRELTRVVPFEAKPSQRDMIGRIGDSLGRTVTPTLVADRLMELFNVDFIRRLQDQDVPVDAALHAIGQIQEKIPDLERLLSSADAINAALDILSGPFSELRDFKAASAIVSGLFSGLLGVEGGKGEATDIVSKVGAIGFPASGIMGTAIEIGMAAGDAFPFLQNEILDQLTMPFFGYVSIRICPPTKQLLGMQQYDPSVMIELVAFGTPSARNFISTVQARTVELIQAGSLDATLHWGLECEQLNSSALRTIPAFNTGTLTKLDRFKSVRSSLHAVVPGGSTVFNNAFTQRLEL